MSQNQQVERYLLILPASVSTLRFMQHLWLIKKLDACWITRWFIRVNVISLWQSNVSYCAGSSKRQRKPATLDEWRSVCFLCLQEGREGVRSEADRRHWDLHVCLSGDCGESRPSEKLLPPPRSSRYDLICSLLLGVSDVALLFACYFWTDLRSVFLCKWGLQVYRAWHTNSCSHKRNKE